MIRLNRILAIVVVFVFAANAYCQPAQLPKKLQNEWDVFIESQIPDADKAFLDELAVRFQDIAYLNSNVNGLFNDTVLRQSDAQHTYAMIKKYTSPYLKSFKKGNHPLLSVESFSDQLPQSSEIKSILDNILMYYERYANMFFSDNTDPNLLLSATGAHYYLDMRLKNFEDSYGATIPQLLDYAFRKYESFSEAAKNHDIRNISVNTLIFSEYFNNAQAALEKQLVGPLEISNRSWLNDALVGIISLVGSHFALNDRFSAAVNQRVAQIAIPREPLLPDLIPTKVELQLPKDIGVKKTVRVLVEFKNTGDLSVEPSKALMVMPDGSKRTVSIPRLRAGQTHLVRLAYRIKKGGENIFTVTANHKQNVFEIDHLNNAMRRSLILPKSAD